MYPQRKFLNRVKKLIPLKRMGSLKMNHSLGRKFAKPEEEWSVHSSTNEPLGFRDKDKSQEDEGSIENKQPSSRQTQENIPKPLEEWSIHSSTNESLKVHDKDKSQEEEGSIENKQTQEDITKPVEEWSIHSSRTNHEKITIK